MTLVHGVHYPGLSTPGRFWRANTNPIKWRQPQLCLDLCAPKTTSSRCSSEQPPRSTSHARPKLESAVDPARHRMPAVKDFTAVGTHALWPCRFLDHFGTQPVHDALCRERPLDRAL